MEALGQLPRREANVGTPAFPLAVALVIVATVAYGLITTAGGADLGTPLPPFLADWQPDVGVQAVPAAALALAAVALAPRLRSPAVSPLAFAGATFVLGLALRIGFGAAREGLDGLYAVFQQPNFEASAEYLPALPALDSGARFFLDRFAELGPSLPVHAVGHPPGLLLTLHALGIDGAKGMTALTIGGGALSVPLTYLLGRRLGTEATARTATLLYLLSPAAILFGATSADALYATLATLAALLLVAARPALRAAGAVALALASFFSYANLAIGAWATVATAMRHGLRRAALVALACGLALALFYALLHAATGFDPVGAVRSAGQVYREGIASRRPYPFWLFGSPAAFLVVLGLPIAWFALRAVPARDAAAVGLVTVLAVAALLGFTKAETERIYLFMIPLACVAAAALLPPRLLPASLAVLAAQALASELLLDTIW